MSRPIEQRKPYKGKLKAVVTLRGVPLPPERVEEWKRAMLWFYGLDRPRVDEQQPGGNSAD